MLRSLDTISRYDILTSDGERRGVVTTLFDTAVWELRYLIVNSGGFSPTPVMLACPATEAPHEAAHVLPVALTADQVDNSPTIVMNMVMTPSTQKRLNECYALYQYWALSGYASATLPLALIASPEVGPPKATVFRDAQTVVSMSVAAAGGVVGTVEDVMVDDELWDMRTVLVRRSGGPSGKLMRIPVKAIERVDWDAGTLAIAAPHSRSAPA